MKSLVLQTKTEIILALRRRETVAFTLLLPIMFLAFFGALYGHSNLRGTHIKYINYFVPGYAVLATMAVALGTGSISLALERQYGILKRIGGTPLPRVYLLAAKIVAIALLVTAVIIVLVVVGIVFYGASLKGNQLSALLVLVVGVFCFSVMGMVMGGTIKPDSSVAVSNLVYLALSFLGGIFIPFDQFPSGLRHLSQVLPSERMVDALQTIWMRGEGLSKTGMDLPVLALWTAAVLVLGIRRFKWE